MLKKHLYKKKLTFKATYLIDLFVGYWLRKKSLKFAQNKMVCYSGDTISTAINLYGVYEKRDLEMLFGFFNMYKIDMKHLLALDIGANIGNHSRYFQKYFNKVIAFEPMSKTFDILKLNVSEFDNIEIKNFGLSSSNGSYYMEIINTNLGGTKIVDSFYSGSKEKFDFVTLDSLKIDGEVGLIKIDVEGHEIDALKGAENLIRRDNPIIMFELNKCDFQNGESPVFNLLKQYGYQYFMHVTRSCKVRSNNEVVNSLVSFLFSRHVHFKLISNLEVADYTFIVAMPNQHERIFK